MQQGKKDMEEKLRQLDNQQLPDLSRMDEHWESMKAAIQPQSSINGSRNKWLLFIGLLLITGTIALFVNRKEPLPEIEIPVKEINVQPATVADPALDDLSKDTTIAVKFAARNTTINRPVKNAEAKNDVGNNVFDLPLQLNTKDSTLMAVGPDAQKKLNELLVSLAKKAEEFIIDNSKDTILFGTEGSSLSIPAKSLGGSGRVKILLKEFYKTSDIVLNKLSTTSNGEQLITGGMVHISASANDKPVNVLPGKSIKWYLPDTSKQMEQMQLFKGDVKQDGNLNWINTGQNFGSPRTRIMVRVLDLRNEPFKTIDRKKGSIGYFSLSNDPELSTEKLKELYREKYGYYKVRFRKERLNKRVSSTGLVDGITYSDLPVGDSVWMSKEIADKYKLPSNQSGISQVYSYSWVRSESLNVLKTGSRHLMANKLRNVDTLLDNAVSEFDDISIQLVRKYSVDINALGWINCDRFYNDRREKINYSVDLEDTAINYFTMMVFDEKRSMMTGYVTGNKVLFNNVPEGEPVKIISIGINKKGETVMAMQQTKISKKGLTGLPFESAAIPDIRSSLKKIDNTQ